MSWLSSTTSSVGRGPATAAVGDVGAPASVVVSPSLWSATSSRTTQLLASSMKDSADRGRIEGRKAAPEAGSPQGKDTVKVLPCPWVDCTETVPPIRSTSCRTRDSPMPAPSRERRSSPRSSCRNRSKTRSRSFSAMPIPVSAIDTTSRRELQGVCEQVEHDALEHVDVDVGHVVELVADHLELETRVLDGWT